MQMAIAVALIAGLPLMFFPRVVTVGLAQNGVATSIVLMAAALTGAITSESLIYAQVLLATVACFLLVIMSGGLGFLRDQKQYGELTLAVILQAPFVYLWLYPVFNLHH